MTINERNQLVIHDGKLMPQGVARALMIEEFTPYGYTVATVDMLLERTYVATQHFLAQLDTLSPRQKYDTLEAALKRDALIAARWRAQSREAREGHAKHLEGERLKREAAAEAAAEQLKAFGERWLEEERQREKEDMLRRVEEVRQCILEQSKADWLLQFQRWEQQNETGGWKAMAPIRAARRVAEIEDRKCALREARVNHNEARLNLFTDRQYIEWMFRCFSNRRVAPI